METITDAFSDFCTVTSVLADADWPKIDIIAISARPIIRALEVAAGRRGLRSEFCVASCPTVPKSRR